MRIQYTFQTNTSDGEITFKWRISQFTTLLEIVAEAYNRTKKKYPKGKIVSIKTIEQ